jgi:hypothetical protein
MDATTLKAEFTEEHDHKWLGKPKLTNRQTGMETKRQVLANI